jgi:hypothetical protein
MRRAARIDTNQPKIVESLRESGYSVAVLSPLGGGIPDILVGGPSKKRGRPPFSILFEIKNPEFKWKLTSDEFNFFKEWRGAAYIIETYEDALYYIKKHEK